jgi:hypothetical protein
MKTANRIALFAASALLVAGISVSTVTSLRGPSFEVGPAALGAVEFIAVAALVWVGTYVGARMAAAQERTARLARVLASLYAVIGVALAISIKTHAVLVEMNTASSESNNYLTPSVLSVGTLLAVALIAVVLARGLAKICGEEIGRDA